MKRCDCTLYNWYWQDDFHYYIRICTYLYIWIPIMEKYYLMCIMYHLVLRWAIVCRNSHGCYIHSTQACLTEWYPLGIYPLLLKAQVWWVQKETVIHINWPSPCHNKPNAATCGSLSVPVILLLTLASNYPLTACVIDHTLHLNHWNTVHCELCRWPCCPQLWETHSSWIPHNWSATDIWSRWDWEDHLHCQQWNS